MKVRFTDDSVRLRVRKSDLEELKTEGATRTTIGLTPCLTFVLCQEDIEHPHARMEGSKMTVSLPTDTARQWMDSDQVGIEYQQQTADGRSIQLLVEKDFPCAHRPQEDKSDTFEELAY